MASAPLQLQFASAGSAVLQKEDGSTSSQMAMASSNNATSITNHPNVTGIGTPAPTTIYFAPNKPIVSDKSYILNGINVPNKIQDVVITYPIGSLLQWCVVNNSNLTCDTIAPAFPKAIGIHPYLIRSFDYSSNLYSDTIGFSIKMIDKADLLQLQQIVGEPILQENSTYNIPITITIENKSGQTIDSLIITNQIRSILPAIVDYQIVNVSVSGKLVRNLLYNGDNNDAITTVESKLEQGEIAIIQLIINIDPKGYSGNITSITNVKAKTFAGVVNYASSPNSNNNGSGTPTMFTLPELPIKVPEIFTPNRDGVNDYFVITRPFDTRIALEVYNRWGTKVYLDNNYKNQWDGKSNIISTNQDLVDGGYYYTITATKLNGTTQILKGFIIIQR
jgi:gliding motility-associated-like protein